MSLLVTKELALVEDIEFGIGASLQLRGGNMVDSSYIPYSVDESVSDAISLRYTSVYTDANFAAINGNELNLFDVADGISGFNAVNWAQLDLKTDKTTTDTKADKANVLELDNATSYTPASDYNPSTKLYVDGSIQSAFSTGVSGSFQSSDGKTITVTTGLITGII